MPWRRRGSAVQRRKVLGVGLWAVRGAGWMGGWTHDWPEHTAHRGRRGRGRGRAKSAQLRPPARPPRTGGRTHSETTGPVAADRVREAIRWSSVPQRPIAASMYLCSLCTSLGLRRYLSRRSRVSLCPTIKIFGSRSHGGGCRKKKGADVSRPVHHSGRRLIHRRSQPQAPASHRGANIESVSENSPLVAGEMNHFFFSFFSLFIPPFLFFFFFPFWGCEGFR